MARIIIDGRATSDAELKFTPGGKAVAKLTVVENKRKKQPDGTWADDGATFYRTTVWERAAEALAEITLKGRRVLVTGDLHAREYDRQDGTKGMSLDVESATIALIPDAQSAERGSGVPRQGSGVSGGSQGDPWASDAYPSEPPFN